MGKGTEEGGVGTKPAHQVCRSSLNVLICSRHKQCIKQNSLELPSPMLLEGKQPQQRGWAGQVAV